MGFTDRLVHAWNAFTSRDPTQKELVTGAYGPVIYRSSFYAPDRTILTMIMNRIAVDAAQVDFRHIRKDENGNYGDEMKTKLNYCLTCSANIDQTSRAFIQDLVQTILEEGHAVIVPVDTDINPESGSFDIVTMRVGVITEKFPRHVRIQVYNDKVGERQEVILPKETVAIIQNPFYTIMNEPNSVLQRLKKTLNNLDSYNEENASGKLNLLFQFPTALRTPLKQQQAENRMQIIENQLTKSKYGMGYIDATEKVIQLNKSIDNNMWQEAQDLTTQLFNHMGLTMGVFNGEGNEKVMNNYYHRTIEPIVVAIAEEMERKFLSKTARSQRQAIVYINDPFNLTTVTEVANMAQVLSSCEIMTSNELRTKLGMKPINNERANELVNKNINKVNELPGRGDEDTEIQNDLPSNEEEE